MWTLQWRTKRVSEKIRPGSQKTWGFHGDVWEGGFNRAMADANGHNPDLPFTAIVTTQHLSPLFKGGVILYVC